MKIQLVAVTQGISKDMIHIVLPQEVLVNMLLLIYEDSLCWTMLEYSIAKFVFVSVLLGANMNSCVFVSLQ